MRTSKNNEKDIAREGKSLPATVLVSFGCQQ